MGNYSNSDDMMLKYRVLPSHAYHPNAALLAARRQGYIAMPSGKGCAKSTAL